MIAPLPHTYWVVPERLLAGPYPGVEAPGASRQILQRLLDAGIRQFVSLMEPIEPSSHGRPLPHYDETLRSLAEKAGVLAAFDRMPIRDMSIPTDDDMEKILDLIDTSLQDDRPVYIHCLGGCGRTGTVVGCYLARHGLARGLEALDRIDFLRRYTETLHHRSPETREQIDMVSRWR